MRFLDVFSGIGGFTLGLEAAGMECVGHVEINEYAQKVLKRHWPDVPLYKDIKEVTGEEFGAVELICGGFPCPAFSRAGKGGGFKQDPIFQEMHRLIRKIRPKYVLVENVEGFTRWRHEFKDEIEGIGYRLSDAILDARDFGIPQSRRRYFGICVSREGMSDAQYLRGIQRIKSQGIQPVQPDYPDSKRRWTSPPRSKGEWITLFHNSTRMRKNNGVSNRSHRLRCLGNAVIPQIIEYLGRQIMEIENGS